MKLVKFALAGIVTLMSVLTVQAQSADEIVDKHIAAIGGKDNWKKVNSVVTEGNLTVQGADVTVVSTVLNGKGARQDISVMGMTGYTIITPSAGWNYMPFQGQTKAEPATEEMVKESADQLDAQGVLIDYKAKGHSVEYLGKEDVDGTECFKLKVTHKSGKTDTYFIDPATYYMLRSITKQKANGQEVEVTTNFSNFQKLPEGIVVPMSITLPFGEMIVKKVEINKAVDENIFKPAN
ncbi:hypothetical protein KJS94_09755 [Flavihumibacter rivuli]|uniref:hypothetical protein n=1 Tax=Flavihumibacter rivuli TaxID=2838156 RepID=UPI001BDE253D|nr:hypothetical protein [Flavihumibacter rivuli]ULQ54922.1 hypothetical protein KJS94_09755 [Flavihumibacter rivuli]